MSDPARFKILAAFHGNEITGFLVGEKEEHRNKIQNIHLKEGVQSWGGGKRLMSRIIDWFDPSKNTYLEVAAQNEKAKRFYERLGFISNGRQDLMLPSGKTAQQLEMVKPATTP